MLQFVLGVIVGGAFGVVCMCLLQINRIEAAEQIHTQEKFEKSISAGVDNPAKKA